MISNITKNELEFYRAALGVQNMTGIADMEEFLRNYVLCEMDSEGLLNKSFVGEILDRYQICSPNAEGVDLKVLTPNDLARAVTYALLKADDEDRVDILFGTDSSHEVNLDLDTYCVERGLYNGADLKIAHLRNCLSERIDRYCGLFSVDRFQYINDTLEKQLSDDFLKRISAMTKEEIIKLIDDPVDSSDEAGGVCIVSSNEE